MGGSGKRGGRGNGGNPKTTNCIDLVINTQLASPKSEVVEQLKKDDVLELLMEPSSNTCLALFNSEIAGTIFSRELIKIEDCINQGHKYLAKVRSVDGGRCTIVIKHINNI